MNGLPYYKAYPRDFIEGTIGMPLELKGAYRVLLDLIYMQGGNLPDDPRYISGLLGCTVRKWNSIRNDLISLGKIGTEEGYLTNERAVIELETLRKLQDKQRENRSRPNKTKDLQSPRSDHTEPEPDKKEDTNVSSQKKRGSRLPENWHLPRDWGEWALSEGWPEQVIRDQADRFRDYWISKSGQAATKRDWFATWRNWMRNSKAPKVLKGGHDDQGTHHSERLQRTIAAAAAGTSGQDWG